MSKKEFVQNGSRDLESRDLEARQHEEAVDFSMEWKNPYNVKPPAGYSYLWVAEFINGQPQHHGMKQARIDGWVAVPGSRHPEFSLEDIFGNKSDLSEFCRYGGSVLCEREERISQIEKRKQAEFNHKKLTSMLASEKYSDDRAIPVTNMNEVKTSRAISF